MLIKTIKYFLYALLTVLLLAALALLGINTKVGERWVAGQILGDSGYTVEVDGFILPQISPLAVNIPRVLIFDASGARIATIAHATVFKSEVENNAGSGPAIGVRLSDAEVSLPSRSTAGDKPLSISLPSVSLDVEIENMRVQQGVRNLLIVDRTTIAFDQESGVSVSLAGHTRRLPISLRALAAPADPASARLKLDADLDYAGIAVNLNGAIEDYRVLKGIDVELGAGGSVTGIELEDDLIQPFKRQDANGRITGDWPYVDLDIQNLIAHTDTARIEMSAHVQRNEHGIDIENGSVHLEGENLGSLLDEFGIKNRVDGAIAAHVEFSGTESRAKIRKMSLRLGDNNLVVNGNGQASLLPDEDRLTLNLDAQSSNLTEVTALNLDQGWFGGEGQGTAELAYRDGVFSLSDVELEFEGEDGSFGFYGGVNDLLKLKAEELKVTLTPAVDSEDGIERTIRAVIDIAEGRAHPVRLKGEMETPGGILGFDAESPKLDFQGELKGTFSYTPRWTQALAMAGEDAGFEGVFSMDQLISKQFAVEGKMRGSDGHFIYQGALTDGGGEGELVLDGINPNRFAELAGLKTQMPQQISGRANLSHDKAGVQFSDLDIALGKTDITGGLDLRFRSAKRAPKLKLALSSTHLELKDLGIDETPGSENYFSTESLNLTALNAFDFDLTLTASRLVTKALEYDNLAASAKSTDGRLELTSSQTLLGGGQAVVTIRADAGQEPPQVYFKSRIDNIDPGELRSIQENAEGFAGDVDVDIEVEGQGHSVAEVLSTANGWFVFRVNSAVIPNRKLQLLSADFLLETIRLINPFVKKADNMELECGLAGFRIVNGMARSNKFIVLKGKKLLIVGEGLVNLRNEKLRLVLRPKAQEGIGLNTSSLVKFIGIGGTLAEPRTRTDTKGLLMSGASIGAAMATGGMSLFLQNIFDRVTTGAKECVLLEEKFRASLLEPPPPEPAEFDQSQNFDGASQR